MNYSEKLTKEEASLKDDNESALMKDVPHQEAVGCLMYFTQSTRPDILFEENTLSRFNNNSGLKHWNAVKHVTYVASSRFMKMTQIPALLATATPIGDPIQTSES